MSHAHGVVRLTDGKILFCEFNGTSDVILSRLYESSGEVEDNWRKQEWKFHPIDCNKIEDAEFVTNYGVGWGWPVKVCRVCMLIVDWNSYYSVCEDEELRKKIIDDIPEWAKEYLK